MLTFNGYCTELLCTFLAGENTTDDLKYMLIYVATLIYTLILITSCILITSVIS